MAKPPVLNAASEPRKEVKSLIAKSRSDFVAARQALFRAANNLAIARNVIIGELEDTDLDPIATTMKDVLDRAQRVTHTLVNDMKVDLERLRRLDSWFDA